VIVGIVPGIGGSVVDWLSYGHTVQTAKDKSRFGDGDIRGVIGPAAADNAKEGGAFIPTILFGIPGSGTMALFLSVLYILGFLPGPEMLTTHLSRTWAIMWSLVLANVIGAGICLIFAGQIAKVTTMKVQHLAPILWVLLLLGAFQATGNWGDLLSLLGIGIFGWFMRQCGWPRPPLLVGFVLGLMAERYFNISVARYGASWLLGPMVIVIGILTISMVVTGLLYQRRLAAEGPQKEVGGQKLGAGVAEDND
jgi:TctA family transporter